MSRAVLMSVAVAPANFASELISHLASLTDELAAASSLLDLARRLGAVCLDNDSLLADLAEHPIVHPFAAQLEFRVDCIDPAVWRRPETTGVFADLLNHDDLLNLVELLAAHHPVEHLAFLRGLCGKPLRYLYDGTEACVSLERGTPVPYASRPINELFADTTPRDSTRYHAHPLRNLPFRLFEHCPPGRVGVSIDFTHRDRLDALTWSHRRRLPRVATLHPFLGMDAIAIEEQNASWFFGVAPRSWKPDEVLAQLRDIDAEIAMLPELSMPAADALEAALAAAPSSYPPIVVAGSAHVREPHPSGLGEVRANESRVYLDGECVLAHRKVHPYLLKVPNGQGGSDRLPEGLTREKKTITVLSGDHTRLAIVICADLNDPLIPSLLEGAAVNLLLVPALTTGRGAFNGTICALASHCQAMAVVVNAKLDPPAPTATDEPFLVMAAVPRTGEQSRPYPDPGDGQSLGVIDVNEDLANAMTWIAED